MKTVIRLGKQVKERNRIGLEKLEGMEIDATVEMIQALIPLGLMHVEEVLLNQVAELVGPRHGRATGLPGHVRWGRQAGSVYLADQKLPIEVPRVRDRIAGKEVALPAYRQFQSPRGADEGLMYRVLQGISCRSYKTAAEAVPEALGLSSSAVSRRFIQASARKLKELMERDLSCHDIVALVLDGKHFGGNEMVTALGITMTGEKVILGVVETATENHAVCREFLQELVSRGLRYEQGILCIIDGSKGLRKAVDAVFTGHVLVQRCQWHKRENVTGYMNKAQQPAVRRRLQQAYSRPTFQDAKSALLRVRKEIILQNESAAKSMDEGFEETLTLHRLGLFAELGCSLKTTNSIESMHALLGARTDKVDHWKNSNQRQRWVAAALLEIEPKLRKVKGYRHLPTLRAAIQAELKLAGNQQEKSA
jgi:putative transposase